MRNIDKHMKFTFTNKETYLAYRSEWKANYKALTQGIRNLKAEMRESGHQITWTEFSQLSKLKAKATAMLEERKESKVEAQRQYWLSKSNTAVKSCNEPIQLQEAVSA
jgi:hypothetical protein